MLLEEKKLIQMAAQVLQEEGASDVYLFGSYSTNQESPDSDIDLAVSGLSPEHFFYAMGKVHDVLKKDFDLVDLDEVNPFTEYLKTKGKLVRVA
jgi:predicted nucleotidyltransferase